MYAVPWKYVTGCMQESWHGCVLGGIVLLRARAAAGAQSCSLLLQQQCFQQPSLPPGYKATAFYLAPVKLACTIILTFGGF